MSPTPLSKLWTPPVPALAPVSSSFTLWVSNFLSDSHWTWGTITDLLLYPNQVNLYLIRKSLSFQMSWLWLIPSFQRKSKLDLSWILDLLFITFSFADRFLNTLRHTFFGEFWGGYPQFFKFLKCCFDLQGPKLSLEAEMSWFLHFFVFWCQTLTKSRGAKFFGNLEESTHSGPLSFSIHNHCFANFSHIALLLSSPQVKK